MLLRNLIWLRVLSVAMLLAGASAALASTYYVDSVDGNDASSGTSPTEPWRSVAQVNGESLRPGDIVRFRSGQSFPGELQLTRSGDGASPITVEGWGSGRPVLYEMTISADYIVVDGVNIDHEKQSGDAVRIRGGHHVILQNMEIRNGTNDGIDADDADDLLIDSVEIHHFLAGALGTQDDAHGIALTDSERVTIRNADIHHVSGDSFQSDSNRVAGRISNDILIEDSWLWTGPLTEDFNDGWRSGDVPGENAIDTKVVTSGYENESRMNITLVNVTAHGWAAGPAVSNRTAFNLKEKINAVLDRITVYDSEIAFRIRGGRGNADTVISNAVIYGVDTALRVEDGLANLRLYNNTFGNDIVQQIQDAGSDPDVSTWDIENNAFFGSLPESYPLATSNLLLSNEDVRNASAGDYRLTPGSAAIGAGVALPIVDVDRAGTSRASPYDVGAFAFGTPDTLPKPPILDP